MDFYLNEQAFIILSKPIHFEMHNLPMFPVFWPSFDIFILLPAHNCQSTQNRHDQMLLICNIEIMINISAFAIHL